MTITENLLLHPTVTTLRSLTIRMASIRCAKLTRSRMARTSLVIALAVREILVRRRALYPDLLHLLDQVLQHVCERIQDTMPTSIQFISDRRLQPLVRSPWYIRSNRSSRPPVSRRQRPLRTTLSAISVTSTLRLSYGHRRMTTHLTTAHNPGTS